MTSWYSPEELRSEASTSQTQPEFTPKDEPDTTTEEAEEALALIKGHQSMTARFQANLVN